MKVPGFTAEAVLELVVQETATRLRRQPSHDDRIVPAQTTGEECFAECLTDVPRIKQCIRRCHRMDDLESRRSCFEDCTASVDREKVINQCRNKCRRSGVGPGVATRRGM